MVVDDVLPQTATIGAIAVATTVVRRRVLLGLVADSLAIIAASSSLSPAAPT